MRKHLSEWTHHLKAKAQSPAAITKKLQGVREFISLFQITGPLEITGSMLIEYQAFTCSRELSGSTKKQKLYAVREFVRYLKTGGLTLIDPDVYIENIKLQRPIPEDIFTEAEISKILMSMRGIKFLRHRAVFELLYATGIRRQELVNLNLHDLNLQERTLFVRKGKGAKDRLLPVTRQAVSVIKQYLKNERAKHARSGPALFLLITGKRIKASHISDMFCHIRKKLKIKRKLSAHSIRHSIATHLLQRGVDIRYVQEFLGHCCIDSTQIYTRVAINHLKKEITKTHPREKMKI